jgi:hypothetical protein
MIRSAARREMDSLGGEIDRLVALAGAVDAGDGDEHAALRSDRPPFLEKSANRLVGRRHVLLPAQ